ncbi:MAG TPA: hypothetical protein H9662_00530 [Firmicutes bacterium]|nr:hypothetical protein [Bacillota bacterium]
MRYHRAQDIFPAELLLEIQKYVDGEYIYIPKLETNKKAWGENTLSKKETCTRNSAIYRDYQSGMGTLALSNKYFLSQKSIQRILAQEKKKQAE